MNFMPSRVPLIVEAYGNCESQKTFKSGKDVYFICELSCIKTHVSTTPYSVGLLDISTPKYSIQKYKAGEKYAASKKGRAVRELVQNMKQLDLDVGGRTLYYFINTLHFQNRVPIFPHEILPTV